MTPPDSGERCAWNGYTDNNLSGQCSLRRGHDGPHEIAKPDSGEREGLHMRDGDKFVPAVEIPLSLAQRILAALEDIDTQEVRAIRAELRARLPR